ncbi:hypothetical protein STRIP9103_06958 [Streptomyces ipomoeae 91-03]|uniref:Uncharacterized protein n=1 Tax=Streptomyces ipomoeae 91-03 TaxID=698759 RepID=L1L4J7_9ACTN|nr:hypothetical protein STRIP9103_06958 [Streptomyces ipomoeae 91-03]
MLGSNVHDVGDLATLGGLIGHLVRSFGLDGCDSGLHAQTSGESPRGLARNGGRHLVPQLRRGLAGVELASRRRDGLVRGSAELLDRVERLGSAVLRTGVRRVGGSLADQYGSREKRRGGKCRTHRTACFGIHFFPDFPVWFLCACGHRPYLRR